MKIAVYILFIFLVAACNHPSTTISQPADTVTTAINTQAPDSSPPTVDTEVALAGKKNVTAPVEKEEEAEEEAPPELPYTPTPSPHGVYRALLPCVNCKGIEHIVAFYPDNTYRIEEKRIEEDTTELDKTTGDWKPTSGVIWLYKDQIVRARYTWQGDTLLYMDPGTKKNIPLHPLKLATENEPWSKKKREGITFFGVGTEPFWNISIDNKNAITFTQANNEEPEKFLPTSSVSTADSVVYHIRKDTTTIKIAIYPRFCSDGMSDYIYPQKVTVHYNGQTYHGCGILY